jgi:hypothetical protein
MAFGTTVGDLLTRVQRDALLASRGAVYTLASAYTAGTTSLSVNEQISHIGQGSILAIDYELFYVQAVSSGTGLVTVIPGYFGTTPANHDINAVVEVDTRFPKAVMLDEVEHEILSWGRQLWRISTDDLTISRSERTYDLDGFTGEIFFLLDVRLRPVGTTTDFWNFSWTGDAWPHAEARLLRNMTVADFPSGTAIQLKEFPQKSTLARIAVAQPFDLSPFTTTTDLIADVGLRREWIDVLELGVRARILTHTVTGRSDWRTGTMSRAAEEVSVFDVMRTVQQAQGLRDARLADEGVELRGEWPYRR